MELLTAYPRTLWTPYPDDLLFPPINNTLLKLCQTDKPSALQLQPCSVWKKNERGKNKTLWWLPNSILFSFILRKMDFKGSITSFNTFENASCSLHKSPSPPRPPVASSLLCPASFFCLSCSVIVPPWAKNANSFKGVMGFCLPR